MRRAMIAGLAGLAAFLSPALSEASAQSVVTYHNTPDRTGDYTVPLLNVAAASGLHLDSHFKADIAGDIYAQPLYWLPPGSKAGILIVATASNLVYGLNANTGAVIWKAQLNRPAPLSALNCGNIDPEGIVGTPVIDPATGTLYLDALQLAANNVARQRIYALSAATGAVLPHWPLDVDNLMAARKKTHPGNPDFDSRIQGERAALQFAGGKLYVSYAGRYGDCGDYRGTVVEFDPAKRTITGSWQTRATGGGIWGRGGLVSDGASLYATTGNTIGTTAGLWRDGEAVVRLLPGLAHSTKAKDYFTPKDWYTLDLDDADLGGTTAVPFTVPSASGALQRVLALGKDGHAYLADGADLGGVSAGLADLQVSYTVILTDPAVYRTASDTRVAFTNFNGALSKCRGNNVTMLKVTSAAANPLAVLWCAGFSGSGAPILTTTNGTLNPIIWVLGAEGDNQLHGFNANTGKVVFDGGGITLNGLHHFQTLIAANHHLYVAGDNSVYAFTF